MVNVLKLTSQPHLGKMHFIILILLIVGIFCEVESNGKCWNRNSDKNILNSTTVFPEVKVSKLIPITTARQLVENEKPSRNKISQEAKDSKPMTIPIMLETLTLECSAKYRVQWGFESFPWITFETWTGVSTPHYKNTSEIYTATIEFHKIQETSLQTRVPICYSVIDPCIQTAVEIRSGSSNTVEMTLAKGSSYSIQSKSEKEQFGVNKNCTLQFGYDPKSQQFYCRETNTLKPQTSGKIFLRRCQDPVTCASLTVDVNCTAQELPSISQCTIENRCRTETSFAGNFPGIAVCHSGNAAEHSAAIPYFFAQRSFNSSTSKTKRYLNWNDVNPSEMLKLQTFDTPVFTKQKITIGCNASYFYLGSGMYFTLFKQDSPAVGVNQEASFNTGRAENAAINLALLTQNNELESAKEKVINEDANINGIESQLPLIRTLELTDFIFQTGGRYELSCYAPVWNTTEWADASTIIIVNESIPPEITGGNHTTKQFYAPYKRLECVAFGMPKPELTWTRDGGTIPSEISLLTGEQNQTLVWAILTFPKMEYGVHGNFTCTATNVAGISEKTFVIIPADKSSATAMWVLIGLAITVTLFIPLILYLTWKVRHQRRYIDDLTQEEVEEFINGRPEYIPFQCDMSTYAYYLPYDINYEITRKSLDIKFSKILGTGEYGLVLYGLYKIANPPSVTPVAIKTTKPLTNGKVHFKALLSELKIMTYIGNHENIVNLIGACTESIQKREVYIAIEYCENGSLLTYLRENRYTYENPLFYAQLEHSRDSTLSAETSFINPIGLILGDGIKPEAADVHYVKMKDLESIGVHPQYENVRNLSMKDLMKFSLDIAKGMEFLASKKVIHADLAARNIMLTRDLICKIGDFGLSRQLFHYNYYTKTALTPLPVKWLAIECLQDFQFSSASDVWAYGITLFELFSIGEIPYSSVQIQLNAEGFLRELQKGMRLNKPEYAPPDVFGLMMECWQKDKNKRPTFAKIVNFFQVHVDKTQ